MSKCWGCFHPEGLHAKDSGIITLILRINVCSFLGCNCKRFSRFSGN